jgi:3-oxoacyl-[acyl-carrier protein] reductase/meso-butanediol dehydrogenase/(S,S)-butanediol dehydrogenase/diacetyl reductase
MFGRIARMITIDLTGKHAIVTGGSAGIGAAVARTLAQAGASVTVLARQKSHPGEDPLLYENPAIGFRELDVADSAAVSAVCADIACSQGIDIAIINAAKLVAGTILETSDETWRELMSVNLDGLFYCTREAIRHMMARGKGGKIVTIGSISGFEGNPGFAAYCSSKGAVVNFTRQVGVDYAGHGINVNSVAPGFVDTKMTAIYNDQTRRYLSALTPNG